MDYLKYLFEYETLPVFEYDLKNKKVVTECTLRPTETIKDSYDYLYALNNKIENPDATKVGKWVFFSDKSNVDELWEKIKNSIREGQLWKSQVQPGFNRDSNKYTIFVYTEDVWNWDDSIKVLEYLEEKMGVVVTEEDPCSVFYQSNRPATKNGDLFRGTAVKMRKMYLKIMAEECELFRYDIHEKKVVEECNHKPTEVFSTQFPWLYALNNTVEDRDPQKGGKWMLFPDKERVNELWDEIKNSIKEGHLWQSKVSTSKKDEPEARHAVMIYTKDYTDLEDVVNVLDYIEKSGWMTSPVIKYKTNNQTRAGVYSRNGQKAWIYTSRDVRSRLAASQRPALSWRVREPSTDSEPKEVPRTASPWQASKKATSWQSVRIAPPKEESEGVLRMTEPWQASWQSSKKEEPEGAARIAEPRKVSSWQYSRMALPKEESEGAARMEEPRKASSWQSSRMALPKEETEGAARMEEPKKASSWQYSRMALPKEEPEGVAGMAEPRKTSSWQTSRMALPKEESEGAARMEEPKKASSWQSSRMALPKEESEGAAGIAEPRKVLSWQSSRMALPKEESEGAAGMAEPRKMSSWQSSRMVPPNGESGVPRTAEPWQASKKMSSWQSTRIAPPKEESRPKEAPLSWRIRDNNDK